MDRRAVLLAGCGVVAAGVGGCLGSGGGGEDDEDDVGDGDDSAGGTASTPPATLGASPTVSSPSFDDGEAIPARFSCEGENVSPELSIAGVPEGASSLALLVDDPDAPGGTFTHWLLWGVPTSTARIPEGVPPGETLGSLGGSSQGTNDAGVVGYSGPCPPPDDGPHAYRFRLFALAEPLDVEAGADRAAFEDALEGVARSSAVLRGTYDR